MVKFGKKLKGFDKGLQITNHEKGREKRKEDDENKIKESRKVKPLTLPKNLLDLTNEGITKEEEYDELDLYLKHNDVHKLLVLLLYKILAEKPVNVCEFIIIELKKLLAEHGELLLKEENRKDENVMKQNFINADIFVKSCDYEQFLGVNHLTLENLTNVLSFLKIENEDQIYINNFIKIIEIVDTLENLKNKNSFLKERINQSDTISIEEATQLVTTFYQKYFYSKRSVT